jgi:hypothetical protein
LDTARIVLDSTAIAGGIKLATEPIVKDNDGNRLLDYRKDNREYLSEGGSRMATTREIRAYKRAWNQRGISVIVDTKETKLPSEAAAAFEREKAEIIIRKKPTLLSLYHEGFHAQQFLELGRDGYAAISPLAREEYVYQHLVSSGLCNAAELENATAYIERLRFLAEVQ